MNNVEVPAIDRLNAAAAWQLLLALRKRRRDGEAHADSVSTDGVAKLTLTADGGWRWPRDATPEAAQLLDLCLPLARGSGSRPITLGHLGQSLDGRIATEAGDSHYITGDENITHLHRLRALCDAVIVGAGTVASDNPRLTTRRVPGDSPVRVVIDPQLRLSASYEVFRNGATPTRIVCRADAVGANRKQAVSSDLLPIETADDELSPAHIVSRLHEEGLFALFLEGGGVTISRFLAAGCLDRLHIAVAPLILGSGRPAFRLPPIGSLNQAVKLDYRSYAMGRDLLLDCDLRPVGPDR